MGDIIRFPRTCERCGLDLRGHIYARVDGVTLCLVCAGRQAPVPDEVQRKIEEQERKHGKRKR